jgi:hypothetical protein
MIHTDGKRTIAHRSLSVEENADAFIRTLSEIQSLPTFDENEAWEDEHRYDHDEVES